MCGYFWLHSFKKGHVHAVVICWLLTFSAGIVHQDDFFEQEGRWRVQNTEDRSEQRRPGLVVEHDDHTGVRQQRAPKELLGQAPGAVLAILTYDPLQLQTADSAICQLTNMANQLLHSGDYVFSYQLQACWRMINSH